MAPRTMQRERTRAAITEAARRLVEGGEEVTMPAVAARARVSEATAYRYFPDLVSLLRDAVSDSWPTMDELLGAELAGVDDVGERVARGARVFCDRTLRSQAAVRAIVAESVRGGSRHRPAHRFDLIDYLLDPMGAGQERTELSRRLSVVISAEALFGLLDLSGLDPATATTTICECARALVADSSRGDAPRRGSPAPGPPAPRPGATYAESE